MLQVDVPWSLDAADLGMTCIWLLPFYGSPDRDNGYDAFSRLTIASAGPRRPGMKSPDAMPHPSRDDGVPLGDERLVMLSDARKRPAVDAQDPRVPERR